ncbi:helix-turn-helix domain-containing protein [Gandjariella thermophila]|uniref:Transcriptional regulator n=1 Tax=Gandjariella thermophila TaxID=1931992 RepID=A0A4D4J4L4_9PSEU|nr:helix-turn-helix transcriptional regulator [Gandjariella thermophila]GDY30012.1 transcriptional regulator [Gandjariella thermophila]
MAQHSIPAIRRLQLGRLLKELREKAGLTQEQAAADLELSDSSLSRIENGQQPAHPLYVRAMLELYRVSVDDWDAVLELAREAVKKKWWHIEGVTATSYVGLEAEAVRLRNFELAVIPGLLQTEGYARALFADYTPRLRDKHLRIRMRRRERLTGANPLVLHAIIHRWALTPGVVDAAVLREQARHLVDMAGLPHVTIQVLPADVGPHAGLAGSFCVLRFPPDTIADLGYHEHPAGQLQISTPDQVAQLNRNFRELSTIALSEHESAALLAALATDGAEGVHRGPEPGRVAQEQPLPGRRRELR